MSLRSPSVCDTEQTVSFPPISFLPQAERLEAQWNVFGGACGVGTPIGGAAPEIAYQRSLSLLPT
jgi:hypothetical protein